ncbi:MAG: DNA-binding response regulator [Verrucomicrobia bacterium]|nr:DNA-binding response regulator [Verrucomicrobiota bacterium]
MTRLSQHPSLIVVVDDDPWLRDLVYDQLELHGFACRTHGTAESYLASNDVALTSCLVLDANLPMINGLELQRQLAEAGHTFPVIFHTGQTDPRVEARARAAGAVDFLEKAAAPAHLIDAIARALARHG